MKMGKKELFSTAQVDVNIEKFLQKIAESERKIAELTVLLQQVEEELQFAITNDILSDGGNKTQVYNIQAKRDNLKSQLEIEELTLKTVKDINTNQLRSAIPVLYEQFKDEGRYYIETVEDEIFRQLSEVRKEQERLLLLLNLARNEADNSLQEYRVLKNSAGYSENEYYIGSLSGEYNIPTVTYKRHPEYGKPVLNIHHLKAIRDTVHRDSAESGNKCKENGVERPAKTEVSREEYQKFLDGLK